jgi:sugar (pentulose or hexulose) kinase
VGLASAHDVGDLTRALFESVAWEIVRCLRSMAPAGGERPAPAGISLGGAGASVAEWVEVLTAVTGLPASRRRSGEAASAGAALLGARAAGAPRDLDQLDPIEWEVEPDPTAVAAYAELAGRADEVARGLVDL